MSPIRRGALGTIALIVGVALSGCTTPQESQDAPDAHVVLEPTDLRWRAGPDSLPPGAEFVVLAGDPAAEGPFTLRIRAPANYTIPPHTHPGIEHVTILEGTGHVGMGATLVRENADEIPAGSFFRMPPGMEHYFFTGNAPATVQLHGQGPWDIEYVDPADDPRT